MIDLGIIKFIPHANPADAEMLTAKVDELEAVVLVSRGKSGYWYVEIDGGFCDDQFHDVNTAAVAGLGYLITHAATVLSDGANPDATAEQEALGQSARAWLNGLVTKLRYGQNYKGPEE